MIHEIIHTLGQIVIDGINYTNELNSFVFGVDVEYSFV